MILSFNNSHSHSVPKNPDPENLELYRHILQRLASYFPAAFFLRLRVSTDRYLAPSIIRTSAFRNPTSDLPGLSILRTGPDPSASLLSSEASILSFGGKHLIRAHTFELSADTLVTSPRQSSIHQPKVSPPVCPSVHRRLNTLAISFATLPFLRPVSRFQIACVVTVPA